MVAAELRRDLVFVDLETTGGSPGYDRIIEVGLVRVRDGIVLEEWRSLVNPQRSISANIESFTGIGNAMVAGAPAFSDLADTIAEKLRGALFIAHNARFDYSFLRREFARLGREFSATVCCTVKLSRKLHPQEPRHNLDAVIERHGIVCLARHRALGDAKVIADVWNVWLAATAPDDFDAALLHSLLKAPKLPDHLPQELADVLPDGPGIYRYYGADESLLYVGKASSLRAKMLAQLGDEQLGSRDQLLAAETRRVEWEETAGELGAMLREAATVQALKPRYNRRRKELEAAVTVRMNERSGQADILRIDALDADDLKHTYGIFHSGKDAQKALKDIAAAHTLCLKVVGLEDSPGSCVALQLGKCKGACTGKEPLLLHNLRLKMALSKLKLKSWPFPGRIALREHARYSDEVHVLDHWSYLGSARSAEELDGVRDARPGGFDVDVYKILVRYFTNHPKIDWRELQA
jgi:DNA polymerase III subunit epsilon